MKKQTDIYNVYDIKINPSWVENTGNIAQGSGKSCKQTNAHLRVCLQDLQVLREIFPVFLTQGRLIYIFHLQKYPFLSFMTSCNDVIDALMLRQFAPFLTRLGAF